MIEFLFFKIKKNTFQSVYFLYVMYSFGQIDQFNGRFVKKGHNTKQREKYVIFGFILLDMDIDFN